MSLADAVSLLISKPKPEPAAIVRRTRPAAKSFRAGFVAEVKQLGDSGRIFRFTASTESPDRYGDVIKASGWNLDAFRRNPIFLWAHRSTDPPIGRCVAIAVDGTNLVADVEFVSGDIYPFAETICNMYSRGFLNATSVGFRPLASPQPIIDEESGTFSGYSFSSQELLELSGVPIPANPDCLQAAYGELRTEASVRRFFGEDNPPWNYSIPGVTHAVAVKSEPPSADPMEPDANEDEPADPMAGDPEKSMSDAELETRSSRLLAEIERRRDAKVDSRIDTLEDFQNALVASN